MKRTNVELIISAVSEMGEATTGEIIGWMQRHGRKPPPPRVISQICSCLPVIKKIGSRGAYAIWGKSDDFDKRIKKIIR